MSGGCANSALVVNTVEATQAMATIGVAPTAKVHGRLCEPGAATTASQKTQRRKHGDECNYSNGGTGGNIYKSNSAVIVLLW